MFGTERKCSIMISQPQPREFLFNNSADHVSTFVHMCTQVWQFLVYIKVTSYYDIIKRSLSICVYFSYTGTYITTSKISNKWWHAYVDIYIYMTFIAAVFIF